MNTVTIGRYDQLFQCLKAYHTPLHLIKFELEQKGVLEEIKEKKGENHD